MKKIKPAGELKRKEVNAPDTVRASFRVRLEDRIAQLIEDNEDLLARGGDVTFSYPPDRIWKDHLPLWVDMYQEFAAKLANAGYLVSSAFSNAQGSGPVLNISKNTFFKTESEAPAEWNSGGTLVDSSDPTDNLFASEEVLPPKKAKKAKKEEGPDGTE